MHSLTIGFAAFVAIFGGALGGLWAARLLPSEHLAPETRTAVSVSVAIVGTLAALVISLLLSTASRSFADRADAVAQMSSDLIQADRSLRRYGPEAEGARQRLRVYAAAKLEELFPEPGAPAESNADTLALIEAAQDAVLALPSGNAAQTFLRTQALSLVDDVLGARWKLFAQQSRSVPAPFLILLVCWLALVFASFGLYAPRNGTAVAVILLCALAVAGGIVMLLELDSPFSGIVRESPEPLRKALVQMEQG